MKTKTNKVKIGLSIIAIFAALIIFGTVYFNMVLAILLTY